MSAEQYDHEWRLFCRSHFLDNEISKATVEQLTASNDVCGICYDQLINSSNPVRLPCGHLFNEDCIMSWFNGHDTSYNYHNSCPHCRRVFHVSCRHHMWKLLQKADAEQALTGEIDLALTMVFSPDTGYYGMYGQGDMLRVLLMYYPERFLYVIYKRSRLHYLSIGLSLALTCILLLYCMSFLNSWIWYRSDYSYQTGVYMGLQMLIDLFLVSWYTCDWSNVCTLGLEFLSTMAALGSIYNSYLRPASNWVSIIALVVGYSFVNGRRLWYLSKRKPFMPHLRQESQLLAALVYH
ncbi:hypothetical protein EJ08DRAFT_694362 [Tothia fuscella]|uniref:RING-type domain-containing protein n=1 Tax=Tothia fuscella TaxID=1048955 RepID=A0A9P4U1Z0_9PEZI|nr:hypothetical protein EJ08DRAFT_694362 [Tothia fuscella]